MQLKDKLIIWIYNKGIRLEQEHIAIQQRVRYHVMDPLDHFEVMRDKIRIETWNEFIDEFFKIINNSK